MHDVINPRYLKIIAGTLLLLFALGAIFSNQVVSFFLSYLLIYKYTTLFVIVFLAGFCVPIPMNILLTAIGALTIEGDFNLFFALIISIVANLIGDLAAVLIFRKYGHSILRDKYVEKYKFFLRLEKFFQDYTNISIYISRIIGVFGTPVNFLSGYLRISLLRFTIFDVIGNFTFALFFLWLGHKVGDRWLAVSDFVNTIITIFAVIIFSFLLSILFYNKKPKNT